VNFKFPGSAETDPGNPFTTTFSLTVSSTAQLDCRPLPVSRASPAEPWLITRALPNRCAGW